ncbi:MAG: OmpA family protein [Deltaproteobacteria bacterium]|nr:OmpA family protein [Deltaproteobacteria bacterium]
MTTSLFQEVMEIFSESVIREIARGLRVDTSTLAGALPAAIASVFSAICAQGKSTDRAEGMLDSILQVADVVGSPSALRESLSGGVFHSPANTSTIILQLIGPYRETLPKTIARMLKIEPSKAPPLITIIVVAVATVLGKREREENIGAAGVRALLVNESLGLEKFLPAPPVSATPGVGSPTTGAKSLTNAPPPKAPKARSGFAFGLATIAAASGALWFLEGEVLTTRPATELTARAGDGAGESPLRENRPGESLEVEQARARLADTLAVSTKRGARVTVQFPSGNRASYFEGSAEEKLANFLGETTNVLDPTLKFPLDSVEFVDESGEPTKLSNAQLRNLAEVLSEFERVRFVIEGHTSPHVPAEASLTLSLARAAAVKRALSRLGISEDRMITRGFGSERPRSPAAPDDRVELTLLTK